MRGEFAVINYRSYWLGWLIWLVYRTTTLFKRHCSVTLHWDETMFLLVSANTFHLRVQTKLPRCADTKISHLASCFEVRHCTQLFVSFSIGFSGWRLVIFFFPLLTFSLPVDRGRSRWPGSAQVAVLQSDHSHHPSFIRLFRDVPGLKAGTGVSS